MVYDATKPATVTSSTSSYSSAGTGKVGQGATYFLRYDGATGAHTSPVLLNDEAKGHQVFPDISADGGVFHALWWDSHNDPCYSIQRPIGNCDDRSTDASLDVYATSSVDAGDSWASATRITDTTTNPNYEQFDNRALPFAGDYLWVTSLGSFAFGTWTDWRDTVGGTDPRETATTDPDADNADVHQCRTSSTTTDKKGNTITTFSGDTCPHDGGIDQNIYGAATP
jgi:hypothetical protein